MINGNYAMGYTIRSKRYRYTAWKIMNYLKGETEGPIVSEEFYDYQTKGELHNLINNQELKTIIQEHREQLKNKLVEIHQNP